MHRDLPESRLSEPVSAWLAGRGFTVWAEVPVHGRSIDLVGWGAREENRHGDAETRRRGDEETSGEGRLVSIELKTSLRREGIRQAMLNQIAVDASWIAVGVVPRPAGLAECRAGGVGVLVCRGEVVAEVLEPGPNRYTGAVSRMLLMRTLQQLEPGGLAGLPCLAGCGPAQEVARSVAAYRREHPAARWAEIWRAVPNHYVSARSLQGAMRMLALRKR